MKIDHFENFTRETIGKTFCKGEGLEIGAGCSPTPVDERAIVHYVDKRDHDDLLSYFVGQQPISARQISEFSGKEYDFLIANHVIEHSANVIETLIEWFSYIRNEGIVFLSVPNRHTSPDKLRLLTPPTHFLHDFMNQCTEDDFESREHICSFLWGWHDVGGLAGKTKTESADLVTQSLNSETNDLHWHTFNIDTIKFVINVAAAIAGRNAIFLLEQDGFKSNDEHRIVVKLNSGNSRISSNITELVALQKKTRDIIYNTTLEMMDGCVTFSLSKDHKGKLFLVNKEKLQWILTPTVLKELDLDNRDYTYLELGSNERTRFGPDIGPINRANMFKRKLAGMEKQLGLEMSPGSAPILDKKEFNVIYTDKFNPIEKTDSYFDSDPIPVDYVLGSNLIDETLPHNTFDYLVSSHVLEHIPDFIQFFKSAANILKSGARLLMYVPDKRYTFDILRHPSTIQDIISAHEQKLKHPSIDMAMDCYLKSDFNAEATGLWDGSYIPKPSLSREIALEKIVEINLFDADLHCFVFTPDSMRQLIDYVIKSYLPEFRVIEISDTLHSSNEFIVDMVLVK